MEKNKNKVIQHYVPQCYLRKFGFNKKLIYKFSKKTGTSSIENIRYCCQVKDFYTLVNRPNLLYIEEDILDHREENFFGIVLNKLQISTLKYLKSKTNKIILNLEEFKILSRCLAVQYLRSPRYRNAAIQKEIKSDYAYITTQCNHIGFDIDEITYNYNVSNIHGDIIESEEIINKHINFFINCSWSFLFTDDFFITSDEPVTIEHEYLIPVLPHETLEYFTQIYYPLNSHLLLKITKSECDSINGLVTEITKDELGRINDLIRLNSRENYFCEIKNPKINEETENE